MELNDKQIKAAQAKVNAARKFILRKQSFFASIMITKLQFKMESCGTMFTDGKIVGWDPVFVHKAPQAKVTYVILHEILHVALRHHLRRGKRDPGMWNTAADYVINPLICRMGLTVRRSLSIEKLRSLSRGFFETPGNYTEPSYAMPSDGLFDPKYFGLNTEQVYRLLEQEGDDDGDQSQSGDGDDNSDGDQSQSGEGDGGQSGQGGWGEVRDFPGADGGAATSTEKAEEELEITQAVVMAEMTSKGRGDAPYGIVESVTGDGGPSQDWKDVLRDLLVDYVPSDYTFDRPNRMHLSGPILMPSVYLEGLGHVAVFTDASGSMSAAEFNQAMADTMDICEELQPECMTLIQFDTKASEPEVLDRGDMPELKRKRRGGTDFRAPFRKAAELGLLDDFDVIIVFTDGGDFNWPAQPDCPVIWASTGAFISGDPPFGEIVSVQFNT